MAFSGMNYIAVLVAAAAGFGFGALYYGSLGKQWMAAARLSADDFKGPGGKTSPLPFIVAAIAQLIIAYILAGLIGHVGSTGISGGIISAVFVWFGFVLTTMAVNHRFQGQRPMLTVIDGTHWLGVLAIMGAIIGWFGA